MKNLLILSLISMVSMLAGCGQHSTSTSKTIQHTTKKEVCISNIDIWIEKDIEIIKKLGKTIKFICDENIEDLKKNYFYFDHTYTSTSYPKYNWIIVDINHKNIQALCPDSSAKKYSVCITGDTLENIILKIKNKVIDDAIKNVR